MVIDFHTHTFPDALAERAVPQLAKVAGIPAYTDGTCACLSASMKKAGIAKSAIMPIATKPAQVQGINRWAADVNEQYPDLCCFGTLHPEMEGVAEEVSWLQAHGIAGVKLHPDYQGFFVDDSRLYPLYRALSDTGLILMFHAGIDIGLPPPTHCPPERLATVLADFPSLTVVAAHMGGWQLWDDVERHLLGKNLYFDTSMCVPFMPESRLTQLINSHGADRILFGTDSPWTDQAQEVEIIRSLDLPETDKTKILGENAGKLLDL